MAAITSIDASQVGAFTAAITTLSADDTITINSRRKQLLVLRNTTGGSLTVTIDGAGASATFAAPGAGTIDLTGGYAITLAAGVSKAVMLGTISGYCQGTVHLLGASTLTAQLFDI